MTRAEAAKIVAYMVEGFPSMSSKFTEANAQVYETQLMDLDFEVTQKALARLLNTDKWLPSIAEIREEVANIQHGPVRAGGEAWGDVLYEIQRTGYMGTPAFSDPLVAEIVERWGWRRLCLEGDDVSDRARFIDLYDKRAAQVRSDLASGIPIARQLMSHTRYFLNESEWGRRELNRDMRAMDARMGRLLEAKPKEPEE